MEMSWPKEQPYSPHLLHYGYNHKNWVPNRKISQLSQISENLCFCQHRGFQVDSYDHLVIKIIPLDHFHYSNLIAWL